MCTFSEWSAIFCSPTRQSHQLRLCAEVFRRDACCLSCCGHCHSGNGELLQLTQRCTTGVPERYSFRLSGRGRNIFCRFRAQFGDSPASVCRSWPISGQLRSNSDQVDPSGHCWSILGQFLPVLGQSALLALRLHSGTCANLGRIRATVDRLRASVAKFGRTRANLIRIRANFDRLPVNVGRNWSSPGQMLHVPVRISSELAQILSIADQLG